MCKMKKSNFILGIIVTAIICITGTSYAAYKLMAIEVSFDNKKTDLSGETVQDGIDEIVDLLKYGDATAGEIIKDKTALVQGKQIKGTIENRGNLNWNPSNGTTYVVPAGYYTGGVLNSSTAYNAGVTAGKTTANPSVAIYYVDRGKITGSTTVSVSLSGYPNYSKGKWYILANGSMTGDGTKDWGTMYINNGSRYIVAAGVSSVSVPLHFSGNKAQAILALVHVY